MVLVLSGLSNVACVSLPVESLLHAVCLVLAMCCNETQKSVSIPAFYLFRITLATC